MCIRPPKPMTSEPEGGDRAEERRHAGGAEALDGEQADQDHEAERHHVGIEGGRHQLEALERREHRDGRGDDGIAVEQRGAHHAEDDGEPGAVPEGALGQGHEREGAALAVVVGPQDQDHVLEGDDDDQRPQDQGDHPDHHLAGQGAGACMAGGGGEALLEGIERAGADVAVDDADGAEGQGPEGGRGGVPVYSTGPTPPVR